ncbi:MAG: peptidoglycan recognition family protein [Burkholderiaceae bacterium]
MKNARSVHTGALCCALALALAITLLAPQAAARKSGAPRTQPVRMVVIHATGGPTCDARTGAPVWIGAGTMADNLRQIEAHPKLGVHYMIDRDGTLRTSVPESQVAHHVFGASARSIGIELINDGDGRDPFPEPQLASLVTLLRGIVQRHGIAREAIVRHSDVDTGRMPCAPGRRRKVDPGDAFPHEAVRERVFAPR